MNVTLKNFPSKEAVLITGANGFIGRELCAQLTGQGWRVRAAVRASCPIASAFDTVMIDTVDEKTDWERALDKIEVVIHLAGRAHVVKDAATDPMADFRRINVEGTLNLARQAANTGIRRFVFISSIKVNGENTPLGQPYTAVDRPAPADPYGISKYEAEESLRRLSSESGMEVVIIRPPLVYGPGVQGNFLTMMRWLDRGIPLPLGLVSNKRTLVALNNLVDLIITCIKHPAAANQTFLAGDNEDLSTTELLNRLAGALGKKAWLLPVPVGLLSFFLGLLGNSAATQKLCGSLQVDIDKTQEMLGWTPPMSVDEALRKTAQDYLRTAK
ncbi:MAG: UDP-glucose 4-epimerase family protein [Methylosarcina sp.]